MLNTSSKLNILLRKQQISECPLPDDYKLVGTNEPQVVKQSVCGLRTHGVGPCIAICAKSMDKNGINWLGMYHWSGLSMPGGNIQQEAFEVLKLLCQALHEQAEPMQLEIHLIGGQNESQNCSGTEVEQKALLKVLGIPEFQSKYKIEQFTHSFNLAKDEESLDIFMRYAINYYIRNDLDECYMSDFSGSEADESFSDAGESCSDSETIEAEKTTYSHYFNPF